MGKISGIQFQAILQRQLENVIEEFRLVMKIKICERATFCVDKMRYERELALRLRDIACRFTFHVKKRGGCDFSFA